jgi:hypothetical protein
MECIHYLWEHPKIDYIANRYDPAYYPDGMDVEAFRFHCLEQAWKFAKGSDREHITPWIKKNFKCKQMRPHKNGDMEYRLGHVRITIDDEDDYLNMREIWMELATNGRQRGLSKYGRKQLFGMRELISLLEQPYVYLDYKNRPTLRRDYAARFGFFGEYPSEQGEAVPSGNSKVGAGGHKKASGGDKRPALPKGGGQQKNRPVLSKGHDDNNVPKSRIHNNGKRVRLRKFGKASVVRPSVQAPVCEDCEQQGVRLSDSCNTEGNVGIPERQGERILDESTV